MKTVFALAALAASLAVPALAETAAVAVPEDCLAMAAQIDEAMASEGAAIVLDADTVTMITSFRDEGLSLCAQDGYHEAGVETLQFAKDFLGLTH